MAGFPYKCTTIIASVFFDIFFFKSLIQILCVSSTSTNLSLQLLFITASAVDIHEFDGTMISDFFFKPKALIAISNASVPLATPRQKLTFK